MVGLQQNCELSYFRGIFNFFETVFKILLSKFGKISEKCQKFAKIILPTVCRVEKGGVLHCPKSSHSFAGYTVSRFSIAVVGGSQ